LKSYKKKEKSLYTLLIKNYVIFAAVLLLAVQILGLLEELMDQKIARLPRIDHPVGEQEKLADEDYGSLSMKALERKAILIYIQQREKGYTQTMMLLGAAIH
jgi:hypothetical protein